MNPPIQTDIESISGNGPVLEELCKLLETGEAIALVGAGASAGLWPLWDQFLKEFIEYGQKHAKITQDDAEFLLAEASHTPLETAQQLRNMIGDSLYFDYLHKTFNDQHSAHTNGAFTRTVPIKAFACGRQIILPCVAGCICCNSKRRVKRIRTL